MVEGISSFREQTSTGCLNGKRATNMAPHVPIHVHQTGAQICVIWLVLCCVTCIFLVCVCVYFEPVLCRLLCPPVLWWALGWGSLGTLLPFDPSRLQAFYMEKILAVSTVRSFWPKSFPCNSLLFLGRSVRLAGGVRPFLLWHTLLFCLVYLVFLIIFFA